LQLTRELDAARIVYKETHPDVKRLVALLEQEKAAERKAEREGKIREASPGVAAAGKPDLNSVARQQQERAASLETQRRHADQEITRRRANIDALEREIAEVQQRLIRLPLREQEMAALTRDYEISQANYRSLLNKNMSVKLSADMEHRQQAERFTVLDSAQPPRKPAQPDRILLSVAACALSLLLASAAALLVEWRRNKVLGEWELPPDIEILGRVPHLVAGPVSRDGRVATLEGSGSTW